jgi:hypothetical protein
MRNAALALGLLAALLAALLAPPPASALPLPPAPAYRLLRADAQGLLLEVRVPSFTLHATGSGLHAEAPGLPANRAPGAAALPALRLALRLPDASAPTLALLAHDTTTVALTGTLARNPLPQPVSAPRGDTAVAPLSLAADLPASGVEPAAPVALQAVQAMADEHLVTLDIAPLQVDWDANQLVHHSRLLIEVRYAQPAPVARQAASASPFAAILDAVAANPGLATRPTQPAPQAQAASPQASNPPATRATSLKLLVERPGIYAISSAQLQKIGWFPGGSLARMQLTRDGIQVPLQEAATAEGSVQLRFHGEPSRSRYQQAQVYWLFEGDSAGLRAPATPGPGTPLRWEQNSFYASLYTAAGDGYFARELRTIDDSLRTTTATLELPAAVPPGARVQLRLQGTVPAKHQLNISFNESFTQTLSWDDAGIRRGSEPPFTGTLVLNSGLPQGTLNLRLTLASQAVDGAYLDWIAFPDTLVPEPSAPLGVADLIDTPSNLAQGAADYLIISHADFIPALAPLVALHESRGLEVQVVDVQDIYDEWGFGMRDPEVIRAFVAHAYRSYSPAPRYLLLVGDGTSNFKDYYGLNDATFIPPYLIDADPWLGEIACDTCYARVAGPGGAAVSDVASDLLPDLFVGRLPVRSLEQAQGLVAKIVAYTASPPPGGWRNQYLFLSDRPRDESGNLDPAGDFSLAAEEAIAQLPTGALARRFRYELAPTQPRPGSVFTTTATLRREFLGAWDQGAALVTYIGHSNQWQWGSAATSQPPYLWNVFDADNRFNGARAPILLSLTCLTGLFQKPIDPSIAGNRALESTTDEWLLLQPGGGTIASLSPSGLGVATGHDLLYQGAIAALTGDDRTQRSLGAAQLAGFAALLGGTTCCRDLLFTYNLLGDPATALPFVAREGLWLPLLRR